MSIRINIPTTKCRAGATISGTVSLHGDVDIDVETITISLVGRCKTKVVRSNGQNSSTTYRGRAPLLEYRQVLFKGPNKLKTNGHSWPFSFTFPTRCVARGADPFKQRHGLFDLNPEQNLPPSFANENHRFGWRGECFIKYELEASLIGSRTKIFSLGDLKTEKTLDFITTRDIETLKPEFIEKFQKIACYSLRLQPGHEDGPLTFKEKLQSMRTSKLPVAMFTLHMLLPKVGILAHSLPLFLKLEHDIEASTTQSPPLVTLRKCIVKLQAITHIQCIRDEIFREGDEQRDWSTEFCIASIDYSANMDKAPPVTDYMNLQQLMRIKIPWHHKPTFSTFNIRRTYRLAVKLAVDCAQKTFKAEFASYRFDLLAADYAFPTGAQEQEMAAPAYGDLSGQLPTYQDAKLASGAVP
ncbi:hypothetical protein IMSHALPRED_000891 [Imshaugia aleurites]|uniref:Arrestin-like N-terminal domain-containing protein n=1 Tax=Imshaugia aleurites TaxID=172621 RepID=A0A8H3EVC6_9LECA|nr:hypothetical protein IMSHALPRED_000891 [Imshaugia aleurites]